jgi:hypothetical protein
MRRLKGQSWLAISLFDFDSNLWDFTMIYPEDTDLEFGGCTFIIHGLDLVVMDVILKTLNKCEDTHGIALCARASRTPADKLQC